MSTGSRKYEIDMCNGPLLGKMLLFYFPLMFSSILQLLFNAADMVVVGRFASANALAAVGSTSSLINLITNLFIGLSVGTNVMVAHYYGANRKSDLSEMVHTSIVTALISGVLLLLIGINVAEWALLKMGSPVAVIDMSVRYLKIYFAGMPFSMVYNFGAAVLRAVGDTRRPLAYLTAAGVINVILNLIFVIVFRMDVAGVAIATVASQAVSACLVVLCLMRSESDYRLRLSELTIHWDKLVRMLQVGLPAGLQGCLFSLSNVIIQSSVNSFGEVVMAGNAAAGNIEGFVYVAMNAFYQTAISFTGQNYGARKFDRMKKIAWISLACVSVVGLLLGNGAYFFGEELLKLYSTDPEVIRFGVLRLSIICTTYLLCGTMDTMVGLLRGIGFSIMPMLVSLTGACLSRIIWIFTYFQSHHTLEVLYASYPLSWLLTFSVHVICYLFAFRYVQKKASAESN